jgi:hypothetical protein
MKYALFIYQPHPFDPKSFSPEEHKSIGESYGVVSATPGVTPGPPLGLPENATTVRVIDGEVVMAAGPYVDVAGSVGGFMIFEADSQDEALALAAKIPAARLGGAVEVRPCEVYW